jgi:hypothetical protein
MVLNEHLKAREVRSEMECFSNQGRHSLFARRCRTSMANDRGRLFQTSADQEHVKQDADMRLVHFDEEARPRLAAMQNRHAAEWEAHNASRPDETPAQFRRRSPQLLERFRQERRLFFQSRFDEATELRRQCAELDVQEAAEAQQRAIDHWNRIGEHLAAKQQCSTGPSSDG